jgi:hypothetical protein
MSDIIVEVHTGIFRKKDETFRKMSFVKLSDLPKEFIESKLLGKRSHNLQEGLELVWDLDSKEFRTFNWKTVIGAVEKETKKIVL